MTWTVEAADAGVRLDKFLAAPGRLGSRGRAADAIARGRIFLNDAETSTADAARRLAIGDRVRAWLDRPGSATRRPSAYRRGALTILYEDDDLIAVDKPPGLLSVPLPRREGEWSVVDELAEHLRSHRTRRPFVVHRIDRDTSGVVLFAKHAAARERLQQQFLHRQPERVYLAIVYGHPEPAAGTWRDRLVWDERQLIQKETHPRDPRGADAISTYRVVERFRDASLVEVRLVTGKRNQIRLQARLRGHMLVGEQRYVFGPDTLRTIEFPRQALHASRLTILHPTTGRPITFEAKMPADMAALITGLRRSGSEGAALPRETGNPPRRPRR